MNVFLMNVLSEHIVDMHAHLLFSLEFSKYTENYPTHFQIIGYLFCGSGNSVVKLF